MVEKIVESISNRMTLVGAVVVKPTMQIPLEFQPYFSVTNMVGNVRNMVGKRVGNISNCILTSWRSSCKSNHIISVGISTIC